MSAEAYPMDPGERDTMRKQLVDRRTHIAEKIRTLGKRLEDINAALVALDQHPTLEATIEALRKAGAL